VSYYGDARNLLNSITYQTRYGPFKSMLSMRSKKPPCSPSPLPLSLVPAARFKKLSHKSPRTARNPQDAPKNT